MKSFVHIHYLTNEAKSNSSLGSIIKQIKFKYKYMCINKLMSTWLYLNIDNIIFMYKCIKIFIKTWDQILLVFK